MDGLPEFGVCEHMRRRLAEAEHERLLVPLRRRRRAERVRRMKAWARPLWWRRLPGSPVKCPCPNGCPCSGAA